MGTWPTRATRDGGAMPRASGLRRLTLTSPSPSCKASLENPQSCHAHGCPQQGYCTSDYTSSRTPHARPGPDSPSPRAGPSISVAGAARVRTRLTPCPHVIAAPLLRVVTASVGYVCRSGRRLAGRALWRSRWTRRRRGGRQRLRVVRGDVLRSGAACSRRRNWTPRCADAH